MLLLLVDGLNLTRRIYAAVPGEQGAAEHADGVLQSSVRSMGRALDDLSPTHGVCVFDAGGESWRRALHAGYKAARAPMPPPLQSLLPRIEEAFERMGVTSVRVAGFEADDVIASIALKVVRRGGRVVVLSTDKAMLTLLGDRVRVRNHFENRDLDAQYVSARFGVAPDKLATFLALVGDRAQGIPGVASVGAKTAAALVARYGSLDAILAAAADMAARPGAALRAGADTARLSLRLVSLRTDVSVGVNLRQLRIRRDLCPAPPSE